MEATGMLQICIVEHDADAGDLLAGLLDTLGHAAEIVTSAEWLLMRDHLDDFDLFLINLGLPGLDGITLGRTLRGHPDALHASLVAFTGHANRRERASLALQAGFDAVFAEPLSVADLEQVLGRVRRRAPSLDAPGLE